MNKPSRSTHLQEIISGKEIRDYLFPLFWQHGEGEEILRNEIRQMHEKGMAGFVVESRPHPDFLGAGWWRDLAIIIDEAKQRSMTIYIFDDQKFPSGFAAGRVKEQHPEFLKVYLAERHLDTWGPQKEHYFLIKPWLKKDEVLIAVCAAQLNEKDAGYKAETLTDLTGHVKEGRLDWDVPPGVWRIFIFVKTRDGGELSTRDYINPIDPHAVRALISVVYQPHYEKLGEEFGKTIKGFFCDEPRFGNLESYQAKLGTPGMVLPFSDDLLAQLKKTFKKEFVKCLPALWYDCASITMPARYAYMDVVSKRFGNYYIRQVGNWCHQHGVKLIGHFVEDNGSHSRLGWSSGHYYRSIAGMDYAGVDVVCQIFPQWTEGHFNSPFGELDSRFFYWGLIKMAASAGHLDPQKNGVTLCESFGAYGWQEGLKLMKWLTDHHCVRGVNMIVPHAFSPKFPDSDWPPHFYAQGNHPQWRYFQYWSAYAKRVCHLLSGGKHVAPLAVLYHAEAEWGGDYNPFEEIVKILATGQIDCDIVPIDYLMDRKRTRCLFQQLVIYRESFRALVIPYSEALPLYFLKRLDELILQGVHIIFMEEIPRRSSFAEKEAAGIIRRLKKRKNCEVVRKERLLKELRKREWGDIQIKKPEYYLRYYHYLQEHDSVYFFTNESLSQTIASEIIFNESNKALAYDALENRFFPAETRLLKNNRTALKFKLAPFESRFIIFPRKGSKLEFPQPLSTPVDGQNLKEDLLLKGPWEVSVSKPKEYPHFNTVAGVNGLGRASRSGLSPEFSGTLRYQTRFQISTIDSERRYFLDLGEVYETAEIWINGQSGGVRICPPYLFEVSGPLQAGQNELMIDVTNTLAPQIPDASSRMTAQEPVGLLGPVRVLY